MKRQARKALTSLSLPRDDIVALKAGLAGQVEIGVSIELSMSLLPQAISPREIY